MLDWIKLDGPAILSWWLLTLLAGVAVYPLIFRLLGMLPSRGYPLARAAGIMLTAFIFWILNMFRLLDNSAGSILMAWLLVIALSVISYFTWKDREPIIPWLKANISLIAATEVLFAVMFVGWLVVRALNPDLTGTEKPMEMAFLSASMRSASLPPHDPWMAGYAISYYHFGYIIMAMFAKMSGVSNGVAFNIAVSLLFALVGVGVAGIAYDLVMAHLNRNREAEVDTVETDTSAPWPALVGRKQALSIALLAAIFAVIIGNLGTGLVEVPYQAGDASPEYMNFWDLKYRPALPIHYVASGETLDSIAQQYNISSTDISSYNGISASATPPVGTRLVIPTTAIPCQVTGSLNPEQWCFWWWFAYSRVVQDRDLSGNGIEIIDEMPQMSFILSDMHPHVLALPFATLAIGLALGLVMRKRRLLPWELLLYGIFIGGMVFLNSWDLVYIGLIIGAEALRRLLVNGTGRYTRDDWIGMVVFGASMIGLTIILYLPFFISFRSQVDGIGANLIWPTRFQQFFLFFGLFLIIIAAFLFVEMRRAGKLFNWRMALQIVAWVLFILVAGLIIVTAVSWFFLDEATRATVLSSIDTSGGFFGTLVTIIERRVSWGAVTELVLLGGILLVIGRLFARTPRTTDGTPIQTRNILTYSPSTGFVLLLIAAGAVLTLIPEFAYVKDGFGNRMNTVFKLYYQAWLFWSIASAYGVWAVLFQPSEARNVSPLIIRGKVVFAGLVTILLAMSLLYPIYGIIDRAWVDGGHANDPTNTKAWTLDGAPQLARDPSDYATIQCLAKVATSDNDVVAEATKHGLAYNPAYGRVSGLTGIPTLLGWDNHEGQWRGKSFNDAANSDINGQPAQNRIDAIAQLYNADDWSQAASIIKTYGITYIYVGPTERENFPGGMAKFNDLTPVCSNGQGNDQSAAYSVQSIGALASAKTGS